MKIREINRSLKIDLKAKGDYLVKIENLFNNIDESCINRETLINIKKIRQCKGKMIDLEEKIHEKIFELENLMFKNESLSIESQSTSTSKLDRKPKRIDEIIEENIEESTSQQGNKKI